MTVRSLIAALLLAGAAAHAPDLDAAPPAAKGDAGTRAHRASTATATSEVAVREDAEVAAREDAEEAAREDAEKKRLDALAKEYEQIEGAGGLTQPGPTPEAPKERSFAATIVQMLLVLGGVVLLAYALLGRLLPRVLGVEPQVADRRIMRVIDRMPLDQRRSLLVVRIGAQYYLVGSADGGVSLLSRLDAQEVDEALASARAGERPTLGALGSLLTKKRG